MARLSQIFAPREREFFDLFEEAGANIVRAAELLERMLQQWPDHGELVRDVVVCEQEGDRITHDIIQRLNSTFVTPIDREDIYALASSLDDIVDFVEEVSDFLGLYGIDPMMVIRWKDIFERLEDAIDATEKTANILEGIVIKNT